MSKAINMFKFDVGKNYECDMLYSGEKVATRPVEILERTAKTLVAYNSQLGAIRVRIKTENSIESFIKKAGLFACTASANRVTKKPARFRVQDAKTLLDKLF